MEGLFLYKIIILYMLDRTDYTLTTSQITNFILDKGYTTLFNIHETLSELIDSKYILKTSIRNTAHYQILDSGEEALLYFENRIPPAIKQDILEFFEAEKINLKKESEIFADYYLNDMKDYTVECIIKDRKETLIDLKFNVPSKSQAITICNNWREKSTDVYESLINQLWLTQ